MPQNITDVDEFTEVVQCPQDGDFATGASIKLMGQGLSNRTRRLKNMVDTMIATIISTVHEWTAQQTFKSHILLTAPAQIFLDNASGIHYDQGPLRKVFLPLKPFRDGGWTPASGSTTGPAWILLQDAGGSPIDFLVGRDLLPSNAKLTRVIACVRSGQNTKLTVTRFGYNTEYPGVNNPAEHDPPIEVQFAPPSTQNFFLTATLSDLSLLNDRHQIRIAIDAEENSNTVLYWILLEFKDPGLKSH